MNMVSKVNSIEKYTFISLSSFHQIPCHSKMSREQDITFLISDHFFQFFWKARKMLYFIGKFETVNIFRRLKGGRILAFEMSSVLHRYLEVLFDDRVVAMLYLFYLFLFQTSLSRVTIQFE